MAKEKLVLTEQSNEQLLAQLGSMESEYHQLKFDHSIRGLGNPLELRDLRRNIARVHTEIRRRELAQMSPESIAMRSKLRLRRRRK
jgi:large subunit ribosomal protein L29